MITKLTKQGTEYSISYEHWENIVHSAGAETVREAERYEREGWPMPIGGDERHQLPRSRRARKRILEQGEECPHAR